jgi:hypothetical protein
MDYLIIIIFSVGVIILTPIIVISQRKHYRKIIREREHEVVKYMRMAKRERAKGETIKKN